MLEETTIQSAANLLLNAAPGAKVILFGSYARGDAQPCSDLDFLVIEPQVKDRMGEMFRLRKMLRGLPVAVDVIVISAERFEFWKDTPNTLAYQALKEGKVYEQVA